MIVVIEYIFEFIGIIVFLAALSEAISELIEKIRYSELLHHHYELKCITSDVENSELYDSTYTFVCQKCGKKKIIHTKGYNAFENGRNKKLKDGDKK